MSALRAGELAVPERGERRPVDNQAGAGARVLFTPSCQEPLQERGYLLAAAQELTEDSKQVGKVGHHVAGQPGLPGRAGDGLDHDGGVAVADIGQGTGEAGGVPAAMLAARRSTWRSSSSPQGSSLASSAATADSQSMLVQLTGPAMPKPSYLDEKSPGHPAGSAYDGFGPSTCHLAGAIAGV
jgi:hypothetical protein